MSRLNLCFESQELPMVSILGVVYYKLTFFPLPYKV